MNIIFKNIKLKIASMALALMLFTGASNAFADMGNLTNTTTHKHHCHCTQQADLDVNVSKNIDGLNLVNVTKIKVDDSAWVCQRCGGTGKCWNCSGTGLIDDKPCFMCSGTGKCYFCDGDGII